MFAAKKKKKKKKKKNGVPTNAPESPRKIFFFFEN